MLLFDILAMHLQGIIQKLVQIYLVLIIEATGDTDGTMICECSGTCLVIILMDS